MSSFTVDLRLHSISGLPSSDSTVELRLRYGKLEQSCATAESYDGMVFLGAWTRLVVEEDKRELQFEVKHTYIRSYFLFSRSKLAAKGTLQLEGLGLEGGDTWREVEVSMDWLRKGHEALEQRVLKRVEEHDTYELKVEEKQEEQKEQAAAAAAAAASAGAGQGKGQQQAAAQSKPSGGNGGGEGSPGDGDDGGDGEPTAEELAREEAAMDAEDAEADAEVAESRTLVLRLSYRARPVRAEEPLPSAGVPEVDHEPVEMVTTALPRLAHCYAHGGFMGLAISMMGEEQWRAILKREDPPSFEKSYKLFSSLVSKDPRPNKRLSALMVCLENSPVLCAYGLVRSGCTAAMEPPPGVALSPASSSELPEVVSISPESKAAFLARKVISSASSPTKSGAGSPGKSLGGGGGGAAPAEGLGSGSGLEPPTQQSMAAKAVEPVLGNQDLGSGAEKVELHGIFLSRSGRRNKRLEEYLDSIKVPNRYGYHPIGLEWDLWIHPKEPSQLNMATVDHGTAGQLVTQAITTAVPCFKSLAKMAGERQISTFGISPVDWMNALGHSVNTAVNGDRSVPLPLAGEEERNYRLKVCVMGAKGGVVSRSDLWDGVYVRGFIDSASVVIPVQRTKGVKVESEGVTWNHSMNFWPLPMKLEKTDLLLEVRGDPAGMRRDKAVGMVRLPLRRLLRQHPELAEGKARELELTIGPKQNRHINETSDPLSKSATSAEEAHLDEDDVMAEVEEAGRGSLVVRLQFETVGVLEACQSLGVTAAAAQSCLAMLSKPGGLYLDVKSAYSTAQDIQLFVTTLLGVGVHCKAVCSFKPQQLEVGGLADTVLFFHGISGLENACDDGVVERGQFVLFNGASFLADLKPEALKVLPAEKAKHALINAQDFPIDSLALRKYTGLCETYAFAGGIYVQEPDASPASVSALVKLVIDYPEYFPLGFAYGHLSGLGINFLDQNGRGFAAQQLVEEFQSRKELSKKVLVRIKEGGHRSASLSTTIAWGQRLVYGSPVISLAEQRTFIILLEQIWPYKHVSKVVDEFGGIAPIFLRFFEHYELSTPLTLLEAGFNINHTKDLIRLLRNRGVMARMPLSEKVELAKFFVSRQLRGYGLTWVLMLVQLRMGLHKFAKEGLVCLLESCSQEEYAKVLESLGGRLRVELRLKGRLRISRHYNQRLRDIERCHKEDPAALAYQEEELKYAALPRTRDDGAKKDPCHMRDKTAGERTWRGLRKAGCLGFTLSYTAGLTLVTCGTFFCCCVGPRMCGLAARRCLGASALVTFLLFVVIVVLVLVLAPWEDVFPNCENNKSNYYNTYICECNKTVFNAQENYCCNSKYFDANDYCSVIYNRLLNGTINASDPQLLAPPSFWLD